MVGKRSPGARSAGDEASLDGPPVVRVDDQPGPPVADVSSSPPPVADVSSSPPPVAPNGALDSPPVTAPADLEAPPDENVRRRFFELRMPRLRRPPVESEVELGADEDKGVGTTAWTPPAEDLPGHEPTTDAEVPEPDEPQPDEPRPRSRRAEPPQPERVGMRSRRRQIQRERRRKAGALSAGAIAAVAGVVALLIAVFVGTVVIPDGNGNKGVPVTRTLLFVEVDAANPDVGAISLTLFGLNDDGSASVVFLPPGTSSEIPARGPDRLGDAVNLSSPNLMRLTVENLLGIRVDSVVTLSSEGMRRFFDPLAPIPITIPERLSAQENNVLVPKFIPGTYEFDSARLVEYMDFRASGEGEIQRLSRHQRAWDAALGRARAIDGGERMAASLGDANLISQAEVAALGEFLSRISDSDRGYALLPVDPKQSLEGEERYEPRTEDIQAMVIQRFAGARSDFSESGRVRLGILNGNGGVGVTEEVAKILIPEGYRVVFTENADNFEYSETQIVFNRTPFEANARDVQRRLGVGKLILNRSPQDVADIIVIVGKDFPPSR
ncbi:MAG: hypothetical protein DCC49_07690 [Acidobacteria bacterium]|nr:MAG: hypothetical protein DCC49_07690 [Acidobacteriota bacterium]